MHRRTLRERALRLLFLLCAAASVLAVALICLFILLNGIPALREIGPLRFLLGERWAPGDVPASFGILPMMLGSVYVTTGAIIVGVPLGVLSAVFMAEYCPARLYRIMKPTVELLAGIPSVVYGFFGLMVLVPLVHDVFGVNGNTILTASLLLGLMILPTIINVSESALRAVPRDYYENAVALGASKERSIFRIQLPAARSGIGTSVLLGVGRALGETMAVIMVAGNQARMPQGILKGIRTLTANIVLEMGYAAELHRGALFATALVLLALILILNALFLMLKQGDNP